LTFCNEAAVCLLYFRRNWDYAFNGVDISEMLSTILSIFQNSFCCLLRLSHFCNPKKRIIMARVCQVTGKKPLSGHSVSHSNIKTKRKFNPNLQTKRFFLAEEDKWVTLKVSADAIRTINKRGLFTVVKELRAQGVTV
jgi:large subunit ribosomal protein L28